MATVQELKAALAAAQDKKAAEARAAAEATELRRLESEIAVASLDGVRGVDVEAVFLPSGAAVAVARPTGIAWQKFRERQLAGKVSSKDVIELVYACLVYPARHPDVAAFEAISEQFPGVLDLACNAVIKLAGMTEEALAGKS